MTSTRTHSHTLERKREKALASWHRDAEARILQLQDLPRGREEHMDGRRRLESLAQTQRFVDQVMAERRADGPRPSAVVVHRSDYVRRALSDLLTGAGVTVLGSASDGAHGLALTLVEQPELVVLEDHLAWVSSVELVENAKLFAPDTQLVVIAEDGAIADECIAAGAAAAYSRRIDLAQLRDHCVELLPVA
jgi:hypothetical protein